jgi:hypothetical protein
MKRIISGLLIGLLAFLLSNFAFKNFSNALENQLLNVQTIFSFSKAKTSSFVLIKIPKEFFNGLDLEEQKLASLDLVNKISKFNVLSLNVFSNSLNFNQEQLETALVNKDINIQNIAASELEKTIQQNKKIILDPRKAKARQVEISQIEDYADTINNHNIALVSPEISEKQLTRLINYIEDRQIQLIQLPSFLLLVLLLALAVGYNLVILPARAFGFLILTGVAVVASQLVFSFSDIHLSIASFIIGNIFILAFSSLEFVDFGNFYQNLSKLRFALPQVDNFKKETIESLDQFVYNNKDASDFKASSVATQVLQTQTITQFVETPPVQETLASQNLNITNNLDNSKSDNLAKLFTQIEINNEETALLLEEKTINAFNSINEKIDELLESPSLGERDLVKASLLKHSINDLLQELDGVLFNLVPFRFETENGLIGIFELLAAKVYSLSQGKMQFSIQTETIDLKLFNEQKYAVYRVIQKLLELISLSNSRLINDEDLTMDIDLNISFDKHQRLRFSIQYTGLPINDKNHKATVEEILKRVKSIEGGAQLTLGNTSLVDLDRVSEVSIELKLFSPLLSNLSKTV